MHYDKFKYNQFSQNGEDGVLAQLILEMQLLIPDMWLVDVGAYDGIAYSNVRKLIESGANAVLIEPCLVGGDCEEKYIKLQHLPKSFSKVHTLNHFTKISDYVKADAGWQACRQYHEQKCNILDFNPPMKTLDESLSDIKMMPDNYDVLNIDIDSYDHQVWQEHNQKPKIVIIEINSGLEPNVINHPEGVSFGESVEIAKSMGYSAVCHTGNIIYVRNDFLNRLTIPKELINSVLLFNRGWIN